MAPNEPEKWGCRMRIRDLFSKILRLIQYYETTRPKKQRVHPLVWHLCSCSKTFSDTGNLKAHINSIHDGQKEENDVHGRYDNGKIFIAF